MSKVRGIRLSEKDSDLVDEFLRKNPFFDFSSLAKTAIMQFIREPNLTIQPVSEKKGKNVRKVQLDG